MNPFAFLAQLVADLRLSQPVRLWLYGVGAVVLAGLVLGGVITEDWHTFGLLALGQVLALPAAELARLGVYSPRHLADAGVLLLPPAGRTPAPALGTVRALPDDTQAFPALFRPPPPRPIGKVGQ